MIRNLFAVVALSVVVAVSFLGGARLAQARIVGGNTANTVTLPDQVCFGGSIQGTGTTSTEVCLDGNGHWVPTTNNAQKLGLSSLQWSDVESTNLNSGGGAITVGGAATFSKAITMNAQLGLQTQTTAQLDLVTTAPSNIGALVAVKWLLPSGSADSYGVCMATSTTVQGGTGTDNDWVWVSTKTTANIGKACQ